MPNPRVFYVTGLPRSRTAWMAAYLSNGSVIGLHEPILRFDWSFDRLEDFIKNCPYKEVGICDSSIPALWNTYESRFGAGPVVIIRRPRHDCFRSLINFLNVNDGKQIVALERLIKHWEGLLNEFEKHPNALTVDFKDLSDSETLKKVWTHAVSSVDYDPIRSENFQTFEVNQKID